MIDRVARNQLAEKMRHFYAGLTTNFEFDDFVFDIKTNDRAVLEVGDACWITYDDIKKHKMVDKHALSEEQKAIIIRAIAFLKTDIEYAWPKQPWWYQSLRPILWVITFGVLTNKIDQSLNGNIDIWPFYKDEDYKRAIETPVYCSNSS